MNGASNLELYDKLINCVVVSDRLKKELSKDLKEAFDDPRTFFDDNNEFILSERGLTYPNDKDLVPTFVFIDTLVNADEIAEIDWKESIEEIRADIIRIINAKDYNIKINDHDTYYENIKNAAEIIKEINNREIKVFGYSIEFIDINSDTYLITIIPLNNQAEAKFLFSKLLDC